MPVYPEAIYVAVTNYYFNNNARDLAKSHNIALIEKDRLLKFIENTELIDTFISEQVL